MDPALGLVWHLVLMVEFQVEIAFTLQCSGPFPRFIKCCRKRGRKDIKAESLVSHPPPSGRLLFRKQKEKAWRRTELRHAL